MPTKQCVNFTHFNRNRKKKSKISICFFIFHFFSSTALVCGLPRYQCTSTNTFFGNSKEANYTAVKGHRRRWSSARPFNDCWQKGSRQIGFGQWFSCSCERRQRRCTIGVPFAFAFSWWTSITLATRLIIWKLTLIICCGVWKNGTINKTKRLIQNKTKSARFRFIYFIRKTLEGRGELTDFDIPSQSCQRRENLKCNR